MLELLRDAQWLGNECRIKDEMTNSKYRVAASDNYSRWDSVMRVDLLAIICGGIRSKLLWILKPGSSAVIRKDRCT